MLLKIISRRNGVHWVISNFVGRQVQPQMLEIRLCAHHPLQYQRLRTMSLILSSNKNGVCCTYEISRMGSRDIWGLLFHWKIWYWRFFWGGNGLVKTYTNKVMKAVSVLNTGSIKLGMTKSCTQNLLYEFLIPKSWQHSRVNMVSSATEARPTATHTKMCSITGTAWSYKYVNMVMKNAISGFIHLTYYSYHWCLWRKKLYSWIKGFNAVDKVAGNYL